MHESIHAEILLLFDTYTLQERYSLFPTLMFYFDNADPEQWQHQYMAVEKFDDLMNALTELYGDEFTQAEYETVVWSGLQNTQAFADTGMTIEQLRHDLKELGKNCRTQCD